MKNWITQIDETTTAFQTSFGTFTEKQLNWKPNPETWSIAQNIDHLITINQTYFPILKALKTGNYQLPFIAKIGFIVSFLGKMIVGAVQPDRKKKIKTFPIWEPAASHISEDILARFAKHQAQLKQEIESAKTLVAQDTIISSPANKYIVYKLATAFDVIVMHEKRHLEQAKELLPALKEA